MVCLAGYVLSYALFLLYIRQSHRKTFWDRRTAWQYVCSNYEDCKTDEMKFNAVFGVNEGLWRARIGEKVKDWIADRLPIWMEEDPPWFDNYNKSRLPAWVVRDQNTFQELMTDEVQEIISERQSAGRGWRKGSKGNSGSYVLWSDGILVPLHHSAEIFSGRSSGRG